MNNLYGLIGYPLGHSFSKGYFEEKFRNEGVTDSEFRNFQIEDIALLPGIIADNPQLRGFNVTIPYKEKIIPHLDRLDGTASAIGAVNCVKVGTDGMLTGYNTDAYGFRISLLEFIGDLRPSALVLGTGGASKAVAYVLRELGIKYGLVSRKGSCNKLSYDELNDEIIEDNILIINTTPLGTYPDTDTCPPIPYNYLTEGHFLFDLVYNPAETMFMKKGRARGAKTVNGYKMLTGQAERAWQIWNGG